MIIGFLLFTLLVLPLPLEAITVRLAFLSIENLSANPRYDYLEGIIRGILLYDLSSEKEIDVVDRNDLESILREQELRLSSLGDDQDAALQVGKILGADYLLKGEYVFLGEDVLVTISLLDVVTARSMTFSERGSSENILHSISEQILYRLTGKEVILQSDQRDRSIISLQDESPATVALHSSLIDAEIFLDDEFMGYTTGNERMPFVIEEVSPGMHTLRIHLDRFGVVKQPEISFHDWEEEVKITPGKRHVIRARAMHFNAILYELMELLREDIRISSLKGTGRISREHDASFIDRQGETVQVRLEIIALSKDKDVEVKAILTYENKPHTLDLISINGQRKEIKQEIGKIELKLSIDQSRISYSIWRTDISQNMFNG